MPTYPKSKRSAPAAEASAASQRASDAGSDAFEAERASIHALAYRMLGSWADAQDVAQDVYLKWRDIGEAGRAATRSPRAWLRKVASRLCLDRLKSARRQRETYVGPWLPEPIPDDIASPAESADRADSISIALMLALERLSSAERAAFLLREVFHYSFAEIAEILERSEPACRQLATRARAAIRSERRRYDFDPERHRQLIGAFLDAVDRGDAAALESVLAEDVTVHSDGGGVARAARKLLESREIASRFFLGLARKNLKAGRMKRVRFATINGLPGVLFYDGDALDTALSIAVSNGRIQAIYQQRNPAKLRALARTTDLAR